MDRLYIKPQKITHKKYIKYLYPEIEIKKFGIHNLKSNKFQNLCLWFEFSNVGRIIFHLLRVCFVAGGNVLNREKEGSITKSREGFPLGFPFPN